MKHFALLFITCLFASPSAVAQTELSIIGESSLSLSPTVSTIQFHIQNTKEEYVAAIEGLTARVDKLVGELRSMGFEEEAIVTSVFSVDKTYQWEHDRSKREEAFSARQILKVTFPYQKDRLLEVLNKTTTSAADASISLSFDIDNKKKELVSKELIELAIDDAKRKASMIAKKTGLNIQSIKKINYGSGLNRPRPMHRGAAEEVRLSSETPISNFEASDLTFDDRIEILFNLNPD